MATTEDIPRGCTAYETVTCVVWTLYAYLDCSQSSISP